MRRPVLAAAACALMAAPALAQQSSPAQPASPAGQAAPVQPGQELTREQPAVPGTTNAPDSAGDATLPAQRPVVVTPQTVRQARRASLPLRQAIRRTSRDALQATLFDLMMLRHNLHQAHWNVIDSDFYQLHEFYAELYKSLRDPIDNTGARMRSLGFPVNGAPSSVARNSAIAPLPQGTQQGVAMNLVLLTSYETLSSALYRRIEATGDDMPTQDHLIGLATMVDKQMWMLRAHLR